MPCLALALALLALASLSPVLLALKGAPDDFKGALKVYKMEKRGKKWKKEINKEWKKEKREGKMITRGKKCCVVGAVI